MTLHPSDTGFVRQPRLKAATVEAHQALDSSIMAHKPFSSVKRYGAFLRVQHAFHSDIDALYDNPVLDSLLPDLAGRRRLGSIERDLADLDLQASRNMSPTFVAGAPLDLPRALGWLYVAEGSNLGAAFLLKAALKLGLSEDHGARHLAGAPEGRGLHWRTFAAALDAIDLAQADEIRVSDAATAAFTRVQGLVDIHFADPALLEA